MTAASPPEDDEPLPYGLPSDPQEPYLSIVAPNLDKLSARTLDATTFGGRRALRGFGVLVAALGGCLLILGGAVAVQWIVGLVGAG